MPPLYPISGRRVGFCANTSVCAGYNGLLFPGLNTAIAFEIRRNQKVHTMSKSEAQKKLILKEIAGVHAGTKGL
jgi:hypothetical protein